MPSKKPGSDVHGTIAVDDMLTWLSTTRSSIDNRRDKTRMLFTLAIAKIWSEKRYMVYGAGDQRDREKQRDRG